MWRRKRSSGDFASEVQAHIDLEANRLREEGFSEEEARQRAHRSFGNVGQCEERFYESHRALWLDTLTRDIFYALRRIAKDKTFTFVAAGTLALGIGTTTAVFTLVRAALLRALPYHDADRIVSLHDVRLEGQSTGGLMGVSRFFDLQKRAKSFDTLAFYSFSNHTLVDGSLPTPLSGAIVNSGFWRLLEVQPLLGRTFTEREDRPNMASVAVISYTAWQNAFAGDRNAIGRQVTLDGKATTIIGVMPRAFHYPSKVDVWTPAQFDPAQWTYRGEGTRFLNVLARLKKDVTLSTAQRELREIGARLRREHPDTDAPWRFSIQPLRDYIYGPVRPALLRLLAASGLLLLIACINVANLHLSRATVRSREVALRRGLGASRGRIFAQFLTESIVLSLSGGAIGLVAAFAFLQCLRTRLPGHLDTAGAKIDWAVMLFAFGISVGTGILFGLAPALQSRRADSTSAIRQGNFHVGSANGNKLRSILVSAEVALSLVLLVGASLLSESLWQLIRSPLGFDPDHVLTFEIQLPWTGHAAYGLGLYDQLQHTLESIPGVVAVGQINALPTADWHLRANFDVDWKPRSEHGDSVNVEVREISGDYLKAMRIPLCAGRDFRWSDAESDRPVVMVNQQFVRRYLPKDNPIGRHLISTGGRLAGRNRQFEIIGVVGDVRGTAGSLAKPVEPEMYWAAEGNVLRRTIVVRSQNPTKGLVQVIRQQVRQIDPTLALSKVATLDDRLNESVAQPRFACGLLSAFAAMALLLACVGVYGVAAYSVAQRSVEIGIRMALGATPMQVCRLFVWRAVVPAMFGVAAGTLLSLIGTYLLGSQLYEVQPNDPLAFGTAIVALILPVLLASLRPAFIAAWMNPVEALRNE